jgi:hypothetical protein
MNVMDSEVLPILDPAADAAGRASRAISLKNYTGMVKLVCYVNQGNAATVALTPEQCTSVAGGGAKAIAATPIFSSQDLATTTVAVRATAAASFTTSAALAAKKVEFLIDPASLDVAGGFDCLRVSTGASNAANITSAFIVAVPKHATELGLNARVD